MDFVADQLADGRRFRALTVIDMVTRECLAIDIGQGLGGHDVAATLERLRFERGLPQRIYSLLEFGCHDRRLHNVSTTQVDSRVLARIAGDWIRRRNPLRIKLLEPEAARHQ